MVTCPINNSLYNTFSAGLKGRNREGGKNRELLRNPKSTDENSREKVVNIQKIRVKQNGRKRPEVKTKIQSYKKRTDKKNLSVKNKKNTTIVRPKPNQQPQKNKV